MTLPIRIGLPAGPKRAAWAEGDSVSRDNSVEHIQFHAGAAGFPAGSRALWFLAQMRRWGSVDGRADLEKVARRVYRPDLLAAVTGGDAMPSGHAGAEEREN